MASQKLKIYFDKKYLSDPKKCELFFYPFVESLASNPDDPDYNRFDDYILNGPNYFEISDNIQNCDLAVYPESWSFDNDRIGEFIAQAEKYKKSAVLFFNNDSDRPINIGENFVFRTSFYHSSKNKHEFAIPGFSEDSVKNYFSGKLLIRPKELKPVVGYCGYAANSLFFLRLKKIIVGPDGWLIRSWAIKNIIKNPAIVSNFIIRNDFWGGAYRPGVGLDYQKMKEVRREFVDNIANSDYVICTRGQGNFSYRLYETLSLGRIPVFVNTDCVLPYEDYINWREICVWVEAKDINNISQKIIDFHNSLSADDFISLQKKCRLTWEEWLSPNGFFKNFYRHFDLK
jgi:hypothetical protein